MGSTARTLRRGTPYNTVTFEAWLMVTTEGRWPGHPEACIPVSIYPPSTHPSASANPVLTLILHIGGDAAPLQQQQAGEGNRQAHFKAISKEQWGLKG